ncbi:DUF2326 domain-containing protein [Lachnospiraceae bacterium 46-61]
MFIKKLIISNLTNIIREIDFCSGLNLIIDDTPIEDSKLTGNNVGKTTVLKLIDFCLGAKGDIIYTDTENKKEVYDVVKNFLINESIEVTLILADDLNDENSKQLEIKRNFLTRKKAIREINGNEVRDKDFENELEKNIIPNKNMEKPTFRQIISHNIRYKDESLNNTLKTLDKYTSDIEYETLYLYLLGCPFNQGAKKQELITKVNQEKMLKERLEQKQTKTTYEMALALINDEIETLNEKKSSFNLSDTLEKDLEQLNMVKYNINKTSSLISKLEIRKNLIEESKKDLEESISYIDLQQLRILYGEVTKNISGIQKTFEDLVAYHNNMIVEKVKYISQDLPDLIQKLKNLQNELSLLITQEKELTYKVAKGDSFEELEKIISELNEKYETKGKYETIISQLNEVDSSINHLNKQIDNIDNYLFSEEFETNLMEQVKKFNKEFSDISQKLYGERYALTFKKETNRKKEQQYYKFNAFNANMSSGKKQGEILCFDLAYLLFADKEKLPCLHFLLNDKKELMHDNQLIKVAEFIQNKNIQLIISILKDKLPKDVLNKSHIAIELSQNDKLFRIEKN